MAIDFSRYNIRPVEEEEERSTGIDLSRYNVAPEEDNEIPLQNELSALFDIESGGRDYEDSGAPVTSKKGALFQSQVMPDTARDPGYGVTPAADESPEEYNRVGREYFTRMVDLFEGDRDKAVAAYNVGPGAVQRAIRQGGDAWLSMLPEETRNHVRKFNKRLEETTPRKPSEAEQRPAEFPEQDVPGPVKRLGDAITYSFSAAKDQISVSQAFLTGSEEDKVNAVFDSIQTSIAHSERPRAEGREEVDAAIKAIADVDRGADFLEQMRIQQESIPVIGPLSQRFVGDPVIDFVRKFPELFDAAVSFVKNPLAWAEFSAESSASSAASLAGAGAGGLVAGTAGYAGALAATRDPRLAGEAARLAAAAGGRGGQFSAMVAIEFGAETPMLVVEELDRRGLQLTRENVAEILADPEVSSRIEASAATKGLTLATVDQAVALASGRRGAQALEKGRAPLKRASDFARATAFEAVVGEGGGELASQAAQSLVDETKEGVDIGDVFAEVAAGAPMSAGQAAAATAFERLTQGNELTRAARQLESEVDRSGWTPGSAERVALDLLTNPDAAQRVDWRDQIHAPGATPIAAQETAAAPPEEPSQTVWRSPDGVDYPVTVLNLSVEQEGSAPLALVSYQGTEILVPPSEIRVPSAPRKELSFTPEDSPTREAGMQPIIVPEVTLNVSPITDSVPVPPAGGGRASGLVEGSMADRGPQYVGGGVVPESPATVAGGSVPAVETVPILRGTTEQPAPVTGGSSDAQPTAAEPRVPDSQAAGVGEYEERFRRGQESVNRAAERGVIRPFTMEAPDPRAEEQVREIGAALGEALGVDAPIVAYDSPDPDAAQGFAYDGATYIKVSDVDNPVANTALHEAKHVIEQIARIDTQEGRTDTPAQKFVQQIESIFDDMSEAGRRVYAERFLYRDDLAAIADPDAREARLNVLLADRSGLLRSEMTADFMGNRATDRAFLRDLAQADPEGFQSFVQKWLDLLDRLLDALKGSATYRNKQSAQVDSYVKDLNRAKMIARDALVEFRRSQQTEGGRSGQQEPQTSRRQPEAEPTAEPREGPPEPPRRDPEAYASARSGRALDEEARSYSEGRREHDPRLGRVLTFEATPQLVGDLTSAGLPAVTLRELPKTRDAALAFERGILASKENTKFGAAVYVYPAEEYQQMRLFQTPDGKSGFAIKDDGDIVSVYSDGGGKVHSMLALAVEQGGTKLDAFDTVLPEIYAISGFKEVSRVSWDENQAPDGWDKETFAPYNNGEPDVVFMEYDPTYNPFADENYGQKRSEQSRDRAAGLPARELAPLEGAPSIRGATGPDPRLVSIAEQYAQDNGIQYERQPEYVQVDETRARRLADAYDAMPHAPRDPAVREAYQNLIRQTRAQYDALVDAGYEFYFYDETNDPYDGNPWNAMRDLRANQRMGVFATEAGFGSSDLDVSDNPLLEDTGFIWGFGGTEGQQKRVLANDLFRAVHDAFGHGLEGAGFRAQGEENAWQAHARLFTGSALGALTSETRGQNSWLNFGPYGEQNRTARVEGTVFADQKTGLMPEWTWTEGLDVPRMSSRQSTPAGRDATAAGLTVRTLRSGIRVYENPAGASISIMENAEYAPRQNSVVEFLTPENIRGRGEGRDVLRRVLDLYGRESISAATSSEPSVRAFYAEGFRPIRNPDATLQDSLAEMREQSSVTMVTPSSDSAAREQLQTELTAATRAARDSGHWGDVERIQAELDGLGVPAERVPEDTIKVDGVERPRKNSDGRDIFPTEDGIRNFWRWFGDSKIVDEEGRPRVVYHGTNQAFDRFDAERRGASTQNQSARDGFWFTDNPDVADDYAQFASKTTPSGVVDIERESENLQKQIAAAERRRDWGDVERLALAWEELELGALQEDEGTGMNILPVYLKSDNPLTHSVGQDFGEFLRLGGNAYFTARALDGGYDGLILQDTTDSPSAAIESNHYVVFNENQIKSATGNRGTFDPTNPDVRFSRTVAQDDGPASPVWQRAVAKGLDMSKDARMQRARAMGFDTGAVYYKGMYPYDWTQDPETEIDSIQRPSPFPAFGDSDGDVSGIAGFLTTDPAVANRFADFGFGGAVFPLLYRARRTLILDAEGAPAGRVQFGEEGREFRDAVRSGQYDTIRIINTADESDVTVALRANNIRSVNAAFDPDDSDSPNIMFSRRFYSDLAEKVKDGPKSAMRDQWKGYINGLTRKGVKPDEIRWSGVIEWLDTQEGKVSRDAVSDYLAVNGVRVEETELGGPRTVDRRTSYGEYVVPGDATNYRELLLTLPASEERSGAYQSAHWSDVPNILAHLRVDDRVDADGNKVLFVNEVQSDWAQEGRKKGFLDRKPEMERLDELTRAMYDVDFLEATPSQQQWALKTLPQHKDTGVTPAPFVGSTDAWVALALKRALIYAAEGGYGKVAFVSGQQAADMFDLSKRISEVTADQYEIAGDRQWRVTAEDLDGRDADLPRGYLTDAELADTVGKELAEKIINDGGGTYTGMDLQVGGEGMRGFYDTIVPKALRDVAKKVGAKVEPVNFLLKKGRPTQYKDFAEWSAAPDFTETSQIGVALTPEMREQILDRGLPMFSRRNALGQTGPIIDWQSPETGWRDYVTYQIQDKFVDLKHAQKTIEDTGKVIDDKWDAYLREGLYHGRAMDRVDTFIRGELRPLLAAMQSYGETMETVEEYLHNAFAPERNAQIAKVNPAFEGPGSGISDEDAAAYMAALDPGRRANLQEIAQQVRDMVHKTQDMLVDYGLETQETINTWRAVNPNYVPLEREEVDFGSGEIQAPAGQGVSVRGGSSRRATGSTRDVVNILGNIALQRERAIARGEKNRVALALYGLAVQNPNTKYWLPVNPDMVLTPTGQQNVQNELVSMGLSPVDARGIIEEPTQAYIDPQTGMVRHQVNPALRNRGNVISARVNGKDRFLFLNENDPRAARMAASLRAMDTHTLNQLESGVAYVTRYLAAVNTQYNPVFGAWNFARDVPAAMINLSTTPIAGKQAAVMAEILPAMAAIYSTTRRERKGKPPITSRGLLTAAVNPEMVKLWAELKDIGGRTAFREQFRTSKDREDAIRKDFERLGRGAADPRELINAAGGWLTDYNDTMENAVRLAVYKVALDNGVSKERGGMLAKDITVNFNRKGAATQQFAAWFAFFNSSIQGIERMGRSLAGPAGKKIVVGGISIGVAQAMVLALAGYDEDQPPEFVKERGFVVPTDLKGEDYFTIAYPLGYHLFPNIGRLLTELWLRDGDDPASTVIDLINVMADVFNPIGNAGLSLQTIFPTVADPAIALAENRDWSGRPIYREQFNERDVSPGIDRMTNTATIWSQYISRALNSFTGGDEDVAGEFSPTPDQIDYLIGQATGGVGREAQKVSQTVQSLFTGEDLPTYKIPLVGRLVGTTRGTHGQSAPYYDNLLAAAKHRKRMEGQSERNEFSQDYFVKNPEARLAFDALKSENAVRKLRKEMRLLIESGADKETVGRLQQAIYDEMKFFNDAVKKAKGTPKNLQRVTSLRQRVSEE